MQPVVKMVMDADAQRTSGWTSQWTRTSRAADASGRGRGSDADASGRGRGSDADAPNHERTRTRLGRGRASAADVPRTRTCLGRGRASDADAPRTRACHGRERSADRRRADTGAEQARAQREAWGMGVVWCCVLLLVVRRPSRSSAIRPARLAASHTKSQPPRLLVVLFGTSSSDPLGRQPQLLSSSPRNAVRNKATVRHDDAKAPPGQRLAPRTAPW